VLAHRGIDGLIVIGGNGDIAMTTIVEACDKIADTATAPVDAGRRARSGCRHSLAGRSVLRAGGSRCGACRDREPDLRQEPTGPVARGRAGAFAEIEGARLL